LPLAFAFAHRTNYNHRTLNPSQHSSSFFVFLSAPLLRCEPLMIASKIRSPSSHISGTLWYWLIGFGARENAGVHVLEQVGLELSLPSPLPLLLLLLAHPVPVVPVVVVVVEIISAVFRLS